MSLITLVWRTDLHISDHTPRSRTDNWTETVLRKIAAVGDIARSVGAHAVIDGGDFFDLKAPVRNSHALIQRVMAVHRDYPCPVYANVGNHDCVYGDYTYLSQQPLGVLYEAGTFKRLYDDHEAVFTVPGAYKCLPEFTVRVVGVPYHGVKYDLDRLARIRKRAEDYLVVVAHLLASPTACTMFDAEDVLRYDVLDNYPDVDCWALGHWHKDQGIGKTPKGTPVVNVGSLTRGVLSQDNLDRVPTVVVMRFDSDGIYLQRVAIPHAPPNEVFDLVARDKDDLQQTMIEEFVEHLSQTFTPSAQKPLTDAVRDIPGVPDVVRERAIDYIEKAGG